MWGVWGQTYHIGYVNNGEGSVWGGLPEGWGFWDSYGGYAYIIKGWGVLRQKLDMLIL